VKTLVAEAMRRGYSVLVVDFDGEYHPLETLPLSLPIETLADVVARVVASEARTSGAATYMAIRKVLREAKQLGITELLRGLELEARTEYSLRSGAQAAWSRLEPLEGRAELCSFEEFTKLLRRTGRFDLSILPATWQRSMVAAVILAALGLITSIERKGKTLIVLEEAHYYFAQGDGEHLERMGLRKGVKIVRVQQRMPRDFLNYVPVIGYGGAQWWRTANSDLSVPEAIRRLRRYEFLYYSPKHREWRKFRLRRWAPCSGSGSGEGAR